jgi:hypothetical protein
MRETRHDDAAQQPYSRLMFPSWYDPMPAVTSSQRVVFPAGDRTRTYAPNSVMSVEKP